MMVLDKEDGRWRAGGRRPWPLAPRRGAREHMPGRGRTHAGLCRACLAGGARGAGAARGRPGGAGGGMSEPGAGGRGAGRVLLCGGRVRARVPSDLGAVALRARRSVFAAARFTAAISLPPAG